MGVEGNATAMSGCLHDESVCSRQCFSSVRAFSASGLFQREGFFSVSAFPASVLFQRQGFSSVRAFSAFSAAARVSLGQA